MSSRLSSPGASPQASGSFIKELTVTATMRIEVIAADPSRCSWSCPALAETTPECGQCFIFRQTVTCDRGGYGFGGGGYAIPPAGSPFRCAACLKATREENKIIDPGTLRSMALLIQPHDKNMARDIMREAEVIENSRSYRIRCVIREVLQLSAYLMASGIKLLAIAVSVLLGVLAALMLAQMLGKSY